MKLHNAVRLFSYFLFLAIFLLVLLAGLNWMFMAVLTIFTSATFGYFEVMPAFLAYSGLTWLVSRVIKSFDV